MSHWMVLLSSHFREKSLTNSLGCLQNSDLASVADDAKGAPLKPQQFLLQKITHCNTHVGLHLQYSSVRRDNRFFSNSQNIQRLANFSKLLQHAFFTSCRQSSWDQAKTWRKAFGPRTVRRDFFVVMLSIRHLDSLMGKKRLADQRRTFSYSSCSLSSVGTEQSAK